MVNKYYTTKITTTVSNLPLYSSRIGILNKPFTLRCGYNTRNKKRWIIITDLDDKPVLTQTFMSVGKSCELNFRAELHNLNFYVTLKPKSPYKTFPENYDYLNWADDFDLYFVGKTQEEVEELRLNGRKLYVGN